MQLKPHPVQHIYQRIGEGTRTVCSTRHHPRARRAFYAIKWNIKFDIIIRIWLKILESIIEPIALYGCEICGLLTNQEFTKWVKHQIETQHAEFCKNILSVQRKTPNIA
jgi:hypothetical protein